MDQKQIGSMNAKGHVIEGLLGKFLSHSDCKFAFCTSNFHCSRKFGPGGGCCLDVHQLESMSSRISFT